MISTPHLRAMTVAFALAAVIGAPPAAAQTDLAPGLQSVLDRTPADQLVVPLERYERFHRNSAEAGQASLLLGQLHHVRGEYRQAADAFMRAAARLDPPRKPEAHYWAGLAWLGSGDVSQARAALEAAARPGSPRRSEALFALATVWERTGRPERAMEVLATLLDENPGPMAAAALERVTALAPALHRDDEAARARVRLAREYPRSIEALRFAAASTPVKPSQSPVRAGAGRLPAVGTAPSTRTPAPSVAARGPWMLQIGAFSDLGRARALADAAHRAGYDPVRVQSLGDPAANLYVVRVGLFSTAEAANNAGAHAGHMLGVPWRVVHAP
jgi:tetratricopeptide (TPR) repeat protein